MKKAMLLVLFTGLFSLLAGCGKSAQEKVNDEKRKNIMGDGNKEMPKKPIGGL